MLFQWYRLDPPTLWIFTYLPARYFYIVCQFLCMAILTTQRGSSQLSSLRSKGRWLFLGLGALLFICYYSSPFAIGLLVVSFLLLMALPIAAERLYPLPDQKEYFRHRNKRHIYIGLACLVVSVTGEAVSVCIAAVALVLGVVIPEVIRRKNLWEGFNPL